MYMIQQIDHIYLMLRLSIFSTNWTPVTIDILVEMGPVTTLNKEMFLFSEKYE